MYRILFSAKDNIDLSDVVREVFAFCRMFLALSGLHSMMPLKM